MKTTSSVCIAEAKIPRQDARSVAVLMVTTKLLQYSGVTAVIMNYLRHMPKSGLSISLLLYPDSDAHLVKEVKALGIGIYEMPKLGIRSVRIFRRFLDDFFSIHHFDVVHSHFCQVDAMVFAAARKHGPVHCISHSHNTKLSDFKWRALRNRLMCWNIAKRADTMAACSEEAGLVLFGKSFATSSRKLVIRNGVDVARYVFNPSARRRVRNEFHVGDEEFLLGHVGEFRPQKNHAFLLRVFGRLCEVRPNCKLLLVGNGATRPAIQEFVVFHQLTEKVVFAGVRSDVPEILSALDCFLLPSIYEGLGLALVEAQISGLPCLASLAVPREAAFSDAVQFLPTGDNHLDTWVSALGKISAADRTRVPGDVGAAGYDISREAVRLAAFYRKVSGKGNA